MSNATHSQIQRFFGLAKSVKRSGEARRRRGAALEQLEPRQLMAAAQVIDLAGWAALDRVTTVPTHVGDSLLTVAPPAKEWMSTSGI